jgi:hypothetical protein
MRVSRVQGNARDYRQHMLLIPGTVFEKVALEVILLLQVPLKDFRMK